MRTRFPLSVAALAIGALIVGPLGPSGADDRKPELLTPERLAERAMHRRAFEAVIWGMPAVNYERMFQAAIDNGAKANQIVYWSRLLDWKNQTLTPNPDAIYMMPFFNTAEAGPMVIEVPAANGGSITGSIMDCWQTPLEDVGLAGVDADAQAEERECGVEWRRAPRTASGRHATD